MKKIIRILMNRDGMTEEEAREYVDEVREEMEEYIAQGDYTWAEEIFESELGLEPDYIMDMFF